MNRLDARTHLFVLILATFFWVIMHGKLAIHCLLLISACYLCYAEYPCRALKFIIAYIILIMLAYLSAPYMAILYIILNTFARAIPLMMIGATIMKANPSQLMGSYQRLHIPKMLLVMVCILIRFFPVLRKEMFFIRDGIRARGLFPNWFDIINHPAMAYECFFMPLIARCLKLSSELGASAELRGLDSPCPRSCIYRIGFSVRDIFAMLLYSAGGIAIYLGVGR